MVYAPRFSSSLSLLPGFVCSNISYHNPHCTSPAFKVLIALLCFDVRPFFQLGLLALLLATFVQRTLPFVQRTFNKPPPLYLA